MNLGARTYVTTEGITAQDATSTARSIGDALAARLGAGLLTGYEVDALRSEADWEDAWMDRETLEAVTGGRLPAIHVSITYDADDPVQLAADHADLLGAYGLRPVYEVNPEER